jgi:penicillin amidase
LDPEQGFAASANQHPVDETYPYWLGTDWPNVDRASRINEMLSIWQKVELKDMIAAQTDVHNAHARRVLPVMLRAIARDTLEGPAYSAYDYLSNWNFQHDPDIIATRVFTYWWWWMERGLWEDDAERQDPPLAWISRDVIEDLLLRRGGSHFWDDLRTEDVVETRSMILARSFVLALDDLTKSFGELGSQWAVGYSRGTDLGHMGRIPGFGRTGLKTGGTSTTVNSIRKSYGPSWRMIVSLEEPIQAWGGLPGGQSGHPGSMYYDRDVDAWVAGEYRELLFLNSPDDQSDRIAGRSVMESGP